MKKDRKTLTVVANGWEFTGFVLFLIEMKKNKGQYLREEIQPWFYDYAPCGVGSPGG